MTARAKGRDPVVAAFLANLGIAAAKFVGAVLTGSAAMLAEGIHSVADTANQGLLLVGERRARRGPTATHPFGHGPERYFWSFVVAVVLFTGGGLFALAEAADKLRHPHDVGSLGWAAAVLGVAAVMEGWSLRTAARASDRERDGRSWWRFVVDTKQADLPVVLLEDTGALLGLGFAGTGLALSAITGNARWDALGSLAIGVLLVAIALVLASEMKSLLVGEAASDANLEAVRSAVGGLPGVEQVLDLRTLQLAPDQTLVTLRFVAASGDDHVVVDTVRRLDRAVAAAVPGEVTVYAEPRAAPAQDASRRAGAPGSTRRATQS